MNNTIATAISEIFVTQPTARFYKDDTAQEVKAITWTIKSTQPPEMWDFFLHLTKGNHLVVELMKSSSYPVAIFEALVTRFPELKFSTVEHEGCKHCGSPLAPMGLETYDSQTQYCTADDCFSTGEAN